MPELPAAFAVPAAYGDLIAVVPAVLGGQTTAGSAPRRLRRSDEIRHGASGITCCDAVRLPIADVSGKMYFGYLIGIVGTELLATGTYCSD